MRTFLTFAALTLALSLSSQTTLFTEDFESGGAGISLNTTDVNSTAGTENSWYLNNIYAGGSGTYDACFGLPFSVNATPSQPGGITGSPNSTYLHVSSDEAVNDGILCASFIAADGFCSFSGNIMSTMTSDIDCSGYADIDLSFYWLCGGSAFAYGEVYYSLDGGSIWTLVPGTYNFSGTWQNDIVSLPAWDDASTLRFGFRFVNGIGGSPTDPPFSVDEIVVSGTEIANEITVGFVDPGPYCPGDIIDVPYVATGFYGASNQFIALLSDETGAFGPPFVDIGFVAAQDGSGTINGTIPLDAIPGTGYRIMVTSSDPFEFGSINVDDITIQLCGNEGCTDPLAYNYDPTAVVDSGCCFYLDTALICGPGTLWNETLGHCEIICQPDLNHNGSIGTGDLLMFLAVFGTNCP